jgi:hypothetical protein
MTTSLDNPVSVCLAALTTGRRSDNWRSFEYGGERGRDAMLEQCGGGPDSRSQKRSAVRSVVENILPWLAGIGAAFNRPTEHFSRPGQFSSDIPVESPAERAAVEAEAISAESAVAKPTAMAIYTDPITADSKICQHDRVNRVAILPDNQEIQRRRDLVRALFNDFWSAFDEKPESFADRLNQAETYLNERLIACGELWKLDATTRAMLGLPPRSNSQNEANGEFSR